MVAVLYISLTLLIYPNTKNLPPSDVNKLVCDLQKALFIKQVMVISGVLDSLNTCNTSHWS